MQNAERTTVKTKIAEAMSKYKSLDLTKKYQKFHNFFGRNLDITKIFRFLEFNRIRLRISVFLSRSMKVFYHGLTRVASQNICQNCKHLTLKAGFLSNLTQNFKLELTNMQLYYGL